MEYKKIALQLINNPPARRIKIDPKTGRGAIYDKLDRKTRGDLSRVRIIHVSR